MGVRQIDFPQVLEAIKALLWKLEDEGDPEQLRVLANDLCQKVQMLKFVLAMGRRQDRKEGEGQ